VIVPKRRRRLCGVDQLVLSLSAKGLTHGEISAHLEEVYGARVSKETVTRITDQVIERMAEWQNRPLDEVYPVMFIDAIHVKIREGQVANRPIYVAMCAFRRIRPPVPADSSHPFRLKPARGWATPSLMLLDR
jgi:transposase-like protein